MSEDNEQTTFEQCLQAYLEEESRERKIRALAIERYRQAGELEIDEGAPISEGEDNGAFVQAWVWVDFTGTSLDKENSNDD